MSRDETGKTNGERVPGMVIDGFVCYAPESAHSAEDYPRGIEADLFALESRHFWFRSRNRIILHMVRRFLGPAEGAGFIEIGCGTGFVLSALASIDGLPLTGAEISLDSLRFTRKRLTSVELIQMDIRRDPPALEFEAAALFDVLEHLDDDARALGNVRAMLRPGGLLFLTVPRHPFLWSGVDEDAFHKRRYTGSRLSQLLRECGFEILHLNSFAFSVFPLVFLSRKLGVHGKRKAQGNRALAELRSVPPFLNGLLGIMMRIDELLIAAGCRLPFGGSIIAVARRIETSQIR